MVTKLCQSNIRILWYLMFGLYHLCGNGDILLFIYHPHRWSIIPSIWGLTSWTILLVQSYVLTFENFQSIAFSFTPCNVFLSLLFPWTCIPLIHHTGVVFFLIFQYAFQPRILFLEHSTIRMVTWTTTNVKFLVTLWYLLRFHATLPNLKYPALQSGKKMSKMNYC